MSANAVVIDLYGVWGNRQLTVARCPFVATLAFDFQGRSYSIRITNPYPVNKVAGFMDHDCCHVVAIDQNIEQSNSLEFGRYRVELRGEENEMFSFVADGVSADSTPGPEAPPIPQAPKRDR